MGKGVFATAAIPKGSLLVVESPMFVCADRRATEADYWAAQIVCKNIVCNTKVTDDTE